MLFKVLRTLMTQWEKKSVCWRTSVASGFKKSRVNNFQMLMGPILMWRVTMEKIGFFDRS